MVAKYLNDRLQVLEFALKLFYVDDLLLIGNLKTLERALKIISDLEDETGIKLNLEKTVLHCPNLKAFEEAKKLLGHIITVKSPLNIDYLNCKIGDNEFVKAWLQDKLKEL